jgi:hypothetical protein
VVEKGAEALNGGKTDKRRVPRTETVIRKEYKKEEGACVCVCACVDVLLVRVCASCVMVWAGLVCVRAPYWLSHLGRVCVCVCPFVRLERDECAAEPRQQAQA